MVGLLMVLFNHILICDLIGLDDLDEL